MVLPIIIFALAFGIILAYLRSSKQMHHREKGERLFNFFNAGAEFMYKVVRFVLEVAPYGVFALIAIAISQQGISIFIPFGKIIGTAALGTGILIAGIYSLLLFAFKLNPLKFFKGAKEAMLTAFVTRSSCGTLPVTMKCADEGLGIDKRIYTFSLPIGATINMHGTTIYLLSVAVFAANAIPYLLTFPEILILMVVAVVISVGVAGIPAGGLIMLTITLSTVFPPAVVGPVVGLIAGIDIILDMIRIMGNVTGDLVCTAMVAKTEGLLDFSKGVWKESNIA